MLIYSFSFLDLVSKSVRINREFFLNLFIVFFFYISRFKWQHDRRKSRNDPHVELDINATNHHSYAISTNDTS